MAWKKDDNGAFLGDSSGNPIWVNEAGEDRPVDYAALMKRLSEVNGESKGRKEELRDLKARLAIFDGIDDLKAWKEAAERALDEAKNASEKDSDLDARFNARLEAATAGMKAQLAAREKSLAEKESIIAKQSATLREMAIGADVRESKLLAERIRPEFRPLLQREMARAGALDEDNRIFYRNAQGKPFYGDNGEYASREEAPLLMLKELGIDAATVLLSLDKGASGSGGLPDSGNHTGRATPKSYAECKTGAEKEAWLKNQAHLKQRK